MLECQKPVEGHSQPTYERVCMYEFSDKVTVSSGIASGFCLYIVILAGVSHTALLPSSGFKVVLMHQAFGIYNVGSSSGSVSYRLASNTRDWPCLKLNLLVLTSTAVIGAVCTILASIIAMICNTHLAFVITDNDLHAISSCRHLLRHFGKRYYQTAAR